MDAVETMLSSAGIAVVGQPAEAGRKPAGANDRAEGARSPLGDSDPDLRLRLSLQSGGGHARVGLDLLYPRLARPVALGDHYGGYLLRHRRGHISNLSRPALSFGRYSWMGAGARLGNRCQFRKATNFPHCESSHTSRYE